MQELIPYITTIVVAIIEAIAYKERKAQAKYNAKAEEHAKRRAEESRLSMAMMNATLQLSIANCNALTGGHNNGNVEAAKKAAEKAEHDYNAFIQGVVANVIN